MQEVREYDVVLVPQPEGGYVVSVPDLPDVVTEGETLEEALAMAKDAIEGYLKAMGAETWPIHRADEPEQVVVRAVVRVLPV
jgi:predicted RNase H-like HicB family nuclease